MSRRRREGACLSLPRGPSREVPGVSAAPHGAPATGRDGVNGTSANDIAARVEELARNLRAIADEVVDLVRRRPAQTAGVETEKYLSLNELCTRIPYAPQTIRNLISAGALRKDVHYRQRQRHGKIVFIWSAIERWLLARDLDRSAAEPFIPTHHSRTRKVR